MRGATVADIFKVHEAARVRLGKWAGSVGQVVDTRADDTGKQTGVRLLIEGVRDGEPVRVERWFKRSELERNHG